MDVQILEVNRNRLQAVRDRARQLQRRRDAWRPSERSAVQTRPERARAPAVLAEPVRLRGAASPRTLLAQLPADRRQHAHPGVAPAAGGGGQEDDPEDRHRGAGAGHDLHVGRSPTSAAAFAPATSFQYRNVGVNLELTPKVNASGEILLELAAEFSILGPDRRVAGTDLPTFLTRNVTRDPPPARRRDQPHRRPAVPQERESTSGIPGVTSIPFIGKLLSNPTKETDNNEVVISITPHLVRGPQGHRGGPGGAAPGDQGNPARRGRARPALRWRGPRAGGIAVARAGDDRAGSGDRPAAGHRVALAAASRRADHAGGHAAAATRVPDAAAASHPRGPGAAGDADAGSARHRADASAARMGLRRPRRRRRPCRSRHRSIRPDRRTSGRGPVRPRSGG